MTIGICDDNAQERAAMRKICVETLEKEHIDYTLIEFESGTAVLDYEGIIELLLLDIEMPDFSGIALKNCLQKSDKVEMIIYVSRHIELMREAFGLHAIGFVRKDMTELQLPEMLCNAVQIKEPHILIEGKEDSRTVCYIEAYHGYVKIVCQHGETELKRITLDSLEDILIPCDFLRIHRKYLVNMRKIDRMYENQVLIGGMKLPIAVRLKTKVKKIYDDFSRRNARYC